VTVSAAPVPPPHSRAPVITLRIPKQHLGSLLKHGLLLQVSSDQLVSAKLQLMLNSFAAKAWKLGNGRRAVPIANLGRRIIPAGKTLRLTIKLTRRARQHLLKVRSLTVTVTFAVMGTGGQTSIAQNVLLKR
jgi:hypothetical protein